ncbi:hypothetical protein [Elizabethkingia ursingii]|jgi:hypothetical protein|uniref:Uncharacterized protein n=1 Tax=Elizabethkingia ursingii TaxID=1756150 RepID=A0AAJ3TPR2_9FLAO|nr:hypothetical protein [Elizabethkingia ursingii]AQX09718.1 hypothetical protein BBD34_14205 [Elizabethkingia ursingii]OPB75450.1 hypothetical protein BAY32_07955 [Elizabethkingia ursingii]
MKNKIYIYLCVILINTLTYTLLNYSFAVIQKTSIFLGYISLGIFGILIMKKYITWFIMFMFNVKLNDYNKYIEKPRLFIYIIFFPILFLFTSLLKIINASDSFIIQLIQFLIYNSFIFICCLFLGFTWTEKFISKFIPDVEETLQKVYGHKSLAEEKKHKIFEKFRQFEIIDDDIELDNFCSIFLNLPLKVNLNYSQLYYFHYLYKARIDAKMDLRKFIEYFLQKNAKPFDYNTIKKEGSRQKSPKNQEFIEEIFNQIK